MTQLELTETEGVTMTAPLQEVTHAILDGEYTSEEVERIRTVCKERLDLEKRVAAAHLQLGDEVVTSSTCRPLYLQRRRGIVTGFKGDRTLIQFRDDEHHYIQGRDRLRGTWRMSAGSITKVEPE